MAYKFWHALMDGGLPALTKSVFFLIRDKAPLVPITTLPFFMIFGVSLQTAYLTNALYLLVVLASVFQMGSLLRGWRAGLIAAFVCATLPAMINSLTLMVFAEEKRYPFSFTGNGEKILDEDRVRFFHFVLNKTGDEGPKYANVNHEQAIQTFNAVKQDFTLLRRLPLPDGDYLEPFMKRSPAPVSAPTPMHPVHVVYGGFIELVGYDFRPVPKDLDSYAITYYWKGVQTVWDDYTVFVHIARSKDRKVVAWQDHRLLNGSHPLYRWRPGEVFAEQYRLQLPNGSYTLKVGLYRPELPAADPLYRPQITAAPTGTVIAERGTNALIGTVSVKRPSGIGAQVSH